MNAKRVTLFIGALTAAMIGVQLTQLTTLNDQQKEAKQELVQAQQKQGKVTQIVTSPIDQQVNAKQATQTVTDFMNTVNTHSVNDYPDVLKDKATLKVINTLSDQLAPSVTFGSNQKFNILTVSINRVFDSQLQYAVVEKSDTQSLVYTLTFDIDEHLVTDIQRLPLQGTYDNEK
ncbi:hypothetical protein [Leuconostoc lactis]|uniref:hypothetical protein n=1 Tax=Leuconostoc lactis TaxID=1246 RepID=UPI0024ACF5D0|nr:hypothetical protein [Leuconostoc lactis]MDI6572936.1 hypothetical protein [Leuconostoc lactis]